MPLCDFPNLAAFKPGTWNEKEYGPDFVKQLLANFKKYSTGPTPYHRPWVSINHDKFPLLANFRFGELSGAHIDGDKVLRFDAKDVPGEVGQWANTGMLREPSLEFVTPKRDATGNIVGGFVGPDGKFVDGPVIKCLTLLGNDHPGVKGMDPLPRAVFSAKSDSFAFRGGITSKFGGTLVQTRDQMIQALQAMGLDVSSLTADVPDELISALLTWAQQLQGAGGGTVQVPDTGTTTQQADTTAAGAVGGGTVAAAQPVPQPVQTTTIHKFNQTLTGVVGLLGGQIGVLRRELGAVRGETNRFVDNTKGQVIDAVFTRMSDKGQLTPAQAGTLRPHLMKLDNVKVEKFADGKGEGTALDVALRDIESTYPVIKPMGRQTPQRQLSTTGTATGGTGALTPDRKARLLRGAGATGNRLHKPAAAATT